MFGMHRRWYAGTGPCLRCGAWLSGGRGRGRAWALTGKRRCKWHGGKSTGPRNWRASVAAMVAGRKRMIERRHAMGLKAPGGRAKGAITSKEAYRSRALTDLLRRIQEEKARKGRASPKP
jgi:hypothetical protein